MRRVDLHVRSGLGSVAVAAVLAIGGLVLAHCPVQAEDTVPRTDAPPAESVSHERDQPPAGPEQQPIVVLIGGNHSDPSPAQVAGKSGRGGNSGLWRLKGDLLEHNHIAAEYFNWNGTRAGQIDATDPGGARLIAHLIRQRHAEHPDAAVILVGNSWGGHTAWQVCQLLAGAEIEERVGTQQSIDSSRLQPLIDTGPRDAAVGDDRDASAKDVDATTPAVIPVELLVFLDPSSFGRGKEPMPTTLPANVERAVNYHTQNSFGWRGWIDDRRLTDIDLGDAENGYLVAGGPRYDSALNWTAHVSAEWDERIHAAIRAQIAATLESVANPGRRTQDVP